MNPSTQESQVALLFVTDGTFLYTLRFDPRSGAVTFFAIHFLSALFGHKKPNLAEAFE